MGSLIKSLLRNLGRSALSSNPTRAISTVLNEARACLLAHDISGAQLRCEAVLDLVPEQADALQLLGLAAQRLRDLDGAAEYLERSVRARPEAADFCNNLGSVLVDLGRAQEAVAFFRKALDLEQGSPSARQNLLFASELLRGRHPQDTYAEHLQWARLHADGLQPKGRIGAAAGEAQNALLDPEKRLRIGYVSSDFRQHALSCFVEPVLAGHTPGNFEVFCYYAGAVVDEVTRRMMRHADHWRSIAGLDDEQAAQQIREDAIDLLVDVSGHTRGNRLLLFARKPAPVQLGFLGYLNTTGMTALDYRITDGCADPPGLSDAVHSETLLRLPHSLWCYQPPEDAPVPTALPALRFGALTFASFNNVAKLNPQVLELWAELLRQLPQSRLLVMAVPSETAAARIRAGLVGIAPERVHTTGRLDRPGYWAKFAEADIALDPFPYAGGTTTCDSLWMGVPVVTLAGDYGFSRSGVTILNNAGLGQLVAASAEEYLGIARRLAADLPSLARMRLGMRQTLRTAPITDRARYMQDLESAYRRVWRDWCAARSARSAGLADD